ncbi:MAG: hypothetical protein QM652_07375 [Legionella sp.]|uniref:hypothetical protein n=1 Tax=Legionella sp. TaxID=459 RepID=UPI0039E66744
MFTSKFKQWLEEYDPYGLQRMALSKAVFVATIATYVYWIFLPVSLQSFFASFLVVAFYESPALVSFAEKERLLIFITIALILISVSFYLVYPFKGTFFFFSVFVLAVTYFTVINYFYALKNLTMLLIVNGTIILGAQPEGNWQVAYNLASSITLAMMTTFIALKIYPNHYLTIWNKAIQKFILCLEEDIESAINQERKSLAQEITHIGMARNMRKLIAHKYRSQAYRVGINLRQIQQSLDIVYYETKNIPFWYAVKANLETLRLNMDHYIPCSPLLVPIAPETKLQHYIINCLQQGFIHWNKLCYLLQK